MSAPIAPVCTMHLTPTGAHHLTQRIVRPIRADVACGPFDERLPLDAD